MTMLWMTTMKVRLSSNRMPSGRHLNILDSGISEGEMDMDLPKESNASASKRKAYEVDFDTLPQDVVESLIRKDIEHISSIFGISVSMWLVNGWIVLLTACGHV